MSQKNRIGGGQIDRETNLTFTFDGRSYQGNVGDTLASALLANGLRLMGRSFKYHRPRGPLTAGSEEPNALVQLRTGARQEPNTRATTAELFDGLNATSQNRLGSMSFDLLAVNDRLSNFLTAGFYYKTFMWPGILPATGCIAKRMLTPAFLSLFVSSDTGCCACATAMP